MRTHLFGIRFLCSMWGIDVVLLQGTEEVWQTDACRGPTKQGEGKARRLGSDYKVEEGTKDAAKWLATVLYPFIPFAVYMS